MLLVPGLMYSLGYCRIRDRYLIPVHGDDGPVWTKPFGASRSYFLSFIVLPRRPGYVLDVQAVGGELPHEVLSLRQRYSTSGVKRTKYPSGNFRSK